MQMVLYSEDWADGREVDWPIVPRQGELVQFSGPEGETMQFVSEVIYVANEDGSLRGISVWLSYGEVEGETEH
jgi:hypothetical protein